MFYMLLYTCIIGFSSLVDGVKHGYYHLTMWFQIPFMLYLINKLMEEKEISLRRSALIFVVIVISVGFVGLFLNL